MIDKTKEFAFAGIPTFFKSGYGTPDQLDNFDIGAFGVPFDGSSSNRSGARSGPAAIRRATGFYNPQTYYDRAKVVDLYQNQKVIDLHHPSILDVGDAVIYPTDPRKNVESIEKLSYAVSKRAFPVVMGGEHSITFPVVTGLVRALKDNGNPGNIGIIHFDSHPDLWESYVTLEDHWHGSPFRNLLEKKVIRGENLVQIGDRTLLDVDEYNYIKEQNIRFFSISDVWELGMPEVMRRAVEHLKDRVDGVYVTIDMDVFDPAYAPGTGTQEPAGLTPKEMLQAIALMCENLKLVGLDIVEVAPQWDPGGTTENLAAFLFHRFFVLYKGFGKKDKTKKRGR